MSLLLGRSHDIAKAACTCNLAPSPVDQVAGPASDSISFSKALITQPNFLWDPDPSAPEDWWSTFASDPSQSVVPAALDSFGQPTDTTESNLEKGNARRRTTSADSQGQKERSLLAHKLEVNRRAQKRFRERRKVATGRHAYFCQAFCIKDAAIAHACCAHVLMITTGARAST